MIKANNTRRKLKTIEEIEAKIFELAVEFQELTVQKLELQKKPKLVRVK